MIDGQPRTRRRRRKTQDSTQEVITTKPDSAGDQAGDEHGDTMSTLAEEQRVMDRLAHECPMPRPKGFIGEYLGFRDGRRKSKDTEEKP